MTSALTVAMKPELLEELDKIAHQRRTTKNKIVAECVQKQLGFTGFSPSDYLRNRGFSS